MTRSHSQEPCARCLNRSERGSSRRRFADRVTWLIFGQRFAATDVVTANESPTFYHLIFSATSLGYCLVYYEHGGIAHSHKVDFLRVSGGQAGRLWGADLEGQPVRAWPTDPTTLAQLRAEIRHGHYDTVHRF